MKLKTPHASRTAADIQVFYEGKSRYHCGVIPKLYRGLKGVVSSKQYGRIYLESENSMLVTARRWEAHHASGSADKSWYDVKTRKVSGPTQEILSLPAFPILVVDQVLLVSIVRTMIEMKHK